MNPPESEAAWIARLLELSPGERPDLLARAAREHPELRERLGRLIAALDPEAPAPGPVANADRVRALELAFAPTDEAGTKVGRYKLLEKIGEGGFGSVWMAEQSEPVRRRVAVKVIKSGMDTREVIARFEAERQALALMDHPHIARVFDAGETEDGRPFFVMELVRGVPLTRYCDENQLSTEARLLLFFAVCQAVQHAHQKGVIHRDLKPSNILVTLHDGVPVPKVIDFGIAKATETQLTDKTVFTQFHAFLGTPAYTSPEQMERGGLDVDTRSDIYSLGVLLYELLTGRPPFDPAELQQAGFEAMRRIIREVDPLRPSQQVGTLTAERRDTVARQRGIDAGRLSVRLRGDLDWMVLHCLEKDRTRRYATAQDLGADVQRHLGDEPVLARPPSSVYRCRKFIRRHRFGFLAGAAIALALLVTLVAVTHSLLRERAARERESELRGAADASARRARLAATQSAQVAQFMSDMLGSVGPNVALGRDTALLREVADSTARRLETELHDQPAVAADLRDTLGGVYLGLGRSAAAEAVLREAVRGHRAGSGPESVETAKSLLLHAVALRRLQRVPEAEVAAQEALSIRRKLLGAEDPGVAEVLLELARLRTRERGPVEARALLEQVLAIRRHAFGHEHPAVAEAIAALGALAQRELDHAAAAPLHAEALAMRRKLLGNEHPEVAESLSDLGYSLAHELDRKREAAAAFGEAFALRRKALGDQHPKVLVSFLMMAGQLTEKTATPEDLALVREFIASQRKVLPAGSALLAPALLAHASIEWTTQRDPVAGSRLEREARALLESESSREGRFDSEVITAMQTFAWSKFVGNVPIEGVTMAEEAVRLARRAAGSQEPVKILPLHILGWIYLGLERYAAAIPVFEECVLANRGPRGEPNGLTLLDQAALGSCYRACGRLADSHAHLERAWAEHRERPEAADNVNRIGFVLAEFGVTLVDEKRFEEAEVMLRQALQHYAGSGIKPLGQRLRPPQRVSSALGRALAGQGRFADAEPLVVGAFEELAANRDRIAGDRTALVREAYAAVIEVYTAWDRPGKVAEWKQRKP